MRAGYTRVSTDDQSLSRQEQILERENIDSIYRDKSTGTDMNRIEFQRLKEEITNGNVDVVVATDMSRIARSVTGFLEFVEFCAQHEVSIEFVEGQMPDFDPDDESPTGDLLRTILAAVEEFFAKVKRQNIREGFEAKKARGEHVGPVPFGYDKGEAGQLHRVQEEYETARLFIKEVKKGRPKRPTARFFGVESRYQSILENAEKYYDVEFDNDEWKLERAKVETGEKDLESLE